MQNVGHYLGAGSCFLLNNPFNLLFFPIAWVVSLPFEKNKPKNSLISNLKALSKRPYYTSHFKVFFLCYFQIWPHTFEERLSVNSCYSELLSKREREGGKKCIRSAYACGDSHKFQFKEREENQQLQILTHFEISARLRSDRSDLGTDCSAPAHAQSSWLNLVFLSKLQGKERSASKLSASQPVTWLPIKRICIPDTAMEIFPVREGAREKD